MSRLQKSINFLIISGIVIAINILGQYFFKTYDLTEEKRYTLSPSTTKVLKKIDDIVFVRVLLEGDFPAGFKRLQNATKDLLRNFKDINPNIKVVWEDPTTGTPEEKKSRRTQLAKTGIIPVSLKIFDGNEYIQKPIYPYALIKYKGRTSKISLLKDQEPGENEEVTLNKSIELLEYKFVNLFQKLFHENKQTIAFTNGHGEINLKKMYRLISELNNHYNVGHLNLDSLITIDKKIDVLIIASPKEAFDDKALFKLDQYLMNGGKILWMIEKMDVSLDSINKYKFYVPGEIKTGLDDLFFKYGVRIKNNLVLDLECTSIPQVVGMQGDKPQTQLFKWYYHPLALPNDQHPIGRNVDRVNMFFPSSIDTLKTKTKIKKTILLTTSPYSRYQFNPVRLNFEILKYPPKRDLFNKGKLPLGILLEGTFESAFKNRVNQEFKNQLKNLDLEYKDHSIDTKQIIISDVDFAKNLISKNDQTAPPIGYNKWERRIYPGNKDFLLNSIEYLLDENNVLESRSKQIKLRLLDAVKTKDHKIKWQLINILLPLLFLGLFGITFNFIRRAKYAKPIKK